MPVTDGGSSLAHPSSSAGDTFPRLTCSAQGLPRKRHTSKVSQSTEVIPSQNEAGHSSSTMLRCTGQHMTTYNLSYIQVTVLEAAGEEREAIVAILPEPGCLGRGGRGAGTH